MKLAGPLLFLALWPLSAAAQQGARPGVPQLAPTAPLPAPSPAASAAAALSNPEPPPPPVEDPMLAPVPPATRVVSSWQDALSTLLGRSLDLRNAYDQVKIAEAQSRIALAAALPTLNGTGTATHQFITNSTPGQQGVTTCTGGTCSTGTTTPTPNYMNGALVLTQPLLAIEAWHGIGTAHVSEDAARLSTADLKRTLAISVGTDIVNVVSAERVAELNRVALKAALEQLELVRRKQRDGAATALDVERMQQQVDTTRANIVTGDEALKQAREALGLALGIPDQVGVPPGFTLNDLVLGAGSSCPVVQKLDERKDIQSLRALLEVADRNVTDVYEQFLPTITAASTVATTTVNTGPAPNTTWNIQALLTVPIWDGGVRYGNLHNAQALRDEAENAVIAAERTATIAILQAERGVLVAIAAEKVAEQARNTNANIDKMTRTMFRAGGQVTSLDVQLAAETLREAEITLALKQAATQQAKLVLALTLAVCHY